MSRGRRVIGRAVPLLALSLVVALLAGCGTKVQNVDPSTEGYVSGRWNDSDARATSEELIQDCLTRPWLPEFRGGNDGADPRIVVGEIQNLTSEHISKEVFMNEIERVLTNSGAVRFVADPGIRDALLDEVLWQRDMAKGEGVAPDVERGVTGADFMLTGTITSIADQVKGNAIVYYQVDLSLTDLRNWEKVWYGSAKRKHLVEGSKIRF